jgi:hypothetical protein
MEGEHSHNIVPVVASAVGSAFAITLATGVTDHVAGPIHKMAKLADDPSRAAAILLHTVMVTK